MNENILRGHFVNGKARIPLGLICAYVCNLIPPDL